MRWALTIIVMVLAMASCRRFIKATETRCRSAGDCTSAELCWVHPYTLVCDTKDGVVPSRGTCLPRECLMEGDPESRSEQLPIIELKR